MESNMMIDGFPGGTVLPGNLQKFNSAMKIDWIRYLNLRNINFIYVLNI